MTVDPIGQPERIRVSVDTGGCAADVEIAFEPGATVADFLAAVDGSNLSSVGPAPVSTGGLWVLGATSGGRSRPTRALRPGERLADVGLLHGDRLVVGSAPDPDSDPDSDPDTDTGAEPVGLRLTIIETGRRRRVRLAGEGPWVVGRSADRCEVVLGDPSVSGAHARLALVAAPDGPRLEVVDQGSRNGTTVDGIAAEAPITCDVGSVIGAGDTEIVVDSATAPFVVQPSESGTVGFNRPPCDSTRPGVVALAAPRPPDPVERPSMPWLSMAVPLVFAAVVLVLSVPGAASITGGGRDSGVSSGYLALSALVLLMSPLMMLASHLEARRSARSAERKGRRAFDIAMVELEAAAASALERERQLRRSVDPEPGALIERAVLGAPELWNLTSNPSLPNVRVGIGAVRSGVVIEHADGSPGTPGGDVDRIRELADRVGVIDAETLVIDLEATPVVGIFGGVVERERVAAALTLRMATTLSPSVLSITVEVDWDWSIWLAHLPTSRHGSVRSGEVWSGDPSPRIELVIADVHAAGEPPRTPALSGSSVVFWMAARVADLPADCGAVIDVAAGAVWWPGLGRVVAPVLLDAVDASAADRWARALAVWRDLGEGGRGRRPLPTSVTLLEVLGADERLLGDPAAVLDRWSSRSGGDDDRLAAPIGIGPDGEVFEVDLCSDGPHGLVAGTTGSGKSELLQTLVVSLAASHAAEAVNFLLIDYKGGAAFGPCAGLPHTVGLITDLDAGPVDRVLVSLAAELRRREALLAAAGAKDLAGMRRAVGESPPRLVIVVDEFATIRDEVPEFIDSMVDIARRGRSLGLHLLMATQRPGGVISDHLRANAPLRISLRAADGAESVEVIGTDDAARLPRCAPGRAIARRSEGDAIEFHAAFSGHRRVPANPGVSRPRVLISTLRHDRGGDSESMPAAFTIGSGTGCPVPADCPTDLERLVATIASAARLGSVPPPRRPWVEPLPTRIDPATLSSASADGVVIGRIDDPERQRQPEFELRFGVDLPLAVFGSRDAGVGRVLETFAVGAAVGRHPNELQIDVITAAVSSIDRLRGLPQVGSVIAPHDAERIGRLLVDLDRRISDSGRCDGEPRRLLLIEDLGALVSGGDHRWDPAQVEALGRIVSSGAAADVHVVLGADRRAAVPLEIAGGLRARLVLAMAGSDDGPGLGVDLARLGRRPPPGRGLFEDRVVQVGLWPQPSARASSSFDAVVEAERRRLGPVRAPVIGRLPERVGLGDLRGDPVGASAAVGDGASGAAVILGLRDRDLDAASVELTRRHLLIAGPMGSGRSTALLTIAESARSEATRARLVLVLSGPSRVGRATPLGGSVWDEVAWGAAGLDLIGELCDRIGQPDRPDGGEPDASPGTIVFIDDATDLDDELDLRLAELAKAGRGTGVVMVVAAEAARARSSFGGVVAEVRRDRHALLLQPDVELDGDLCGVRLAHRRHRRSVPGRGELVVGGTAELVQVALPAGEHPHIGSPARVLR